MRRTEREQNGVQAQRRALLRLGALSAGCAAFGLPLAWSAGKSPGARSPTDAWLGDIRPEGARVILDPARMPQEFFEVPMLAEAVREGRLPPVRERIGRDPLVIEPLREIGQHGGTLRRAFIGPSDFIGAARFTTGPDSFLYWDYEWRHVVPNIARGFELSRDERTLTLFLRRGMRWSDGVPFTADDVMFWYSDMYQDTRVVARPSMILRIDGKDVLVEKLDDATIQFVSPVRYPLLPELLAGYSDLSGPALFGRVGMGGYAPKHYLSGFHPKYSSEAQASRLAKEAGFVSWPLYLRNRNDWSVNPQLPVLMPWHVVSPINSRRFALERNPYSIWVDTAGKQLPYIDRIEHALCSRPEIVVLKAVAGELDFQDRHLDIAKLPVLLSNRKRSRYRVFLDPSTGTDLAVRINLGYAADAEIGTLLRTADFRRALSLGIDRDAFNEAFMHGLAQPSASVPVPGSRYFPGEQWIRRWAVHDVVAADRLLDGLGYVRRDRAGFRLRKDGQGRLRLVLDAPVSLIDYGAVGELLGEQWRVIGIDLEVKLVESTLFLQRARAGSIQLASASISGEDPFAYPQHLFPFEASGSSAIIGPDYVRWFRSNGAAGAEPPAVLKEMMSLWAQGRSEGPQERLRIARRIIEIHVEEVLSLGILSGGMSFYGLHLAKNTLGNVPRRVVNSLVVRTPLNLLPMTFFFKDGAG